MASCAPTPPASNKIALMSASVPPMASGHGERAPLGACPQLLHSNVFARFHDNEPGEISAAICCGLMLCGSCHRRAAADSSPRSRSFQPLSYRSSAEEGAACHTVPRLVRLLLRGPRGQEACHSFGHRQRFHAGRQPAFRPSRSGPPKANQQRRPGFVL